MAEPPGTADGVESTAQAGDVDSSERISVNVPGAADLHGPARISFEKNVRAFAVDLLQEASREEGASREDSSDTVQYTSGHVERAALFVRRVGTTKRKRSKRNVAATILSPFGYGTAGVLVPMSPESVWFGVLGVTAGFIGLFLHYYVEADRKDVR